MIHVAVESFENFREQCRMLVRRGIPPQEVIWTEASAGQMALMPTAEFEAEAARSKLRVPRKYFELARLVAAHRDAAKWSLLYTALWRMTHGEPKLLAVKIDAVVLRLEHMRQEIARDIHHMHAFVRFKKIEREDGEWFVAWYRPDHRVLRLAAPFFAERFAAMKWAILTPEESVHWDGERLWFSEGVERAKAPAEDELESLWGTYYATTFNPARTNLELMRQEMPVRFWAELPELTQLQKTLTEIPERLEKMRRQQAMSAAELVPQTAELRVLAEAARECRACPLHECATQTVFGEGQQEARIVLVGEQPGDAEDLAGRPFVGPAGEVLMRAMTEAGITREQVYVTNAVKHFKHVREGKRRIHQTPRMSEVIACKPWLEAELEAIRPEVIVLLGATAAKSLLGSTVRITRDAGKVMRTKWADRTVVTVHPSWVLRADESQAVEIFGRLVRDLKTAREAVAAGDEKLVHSGEYPL